MGGKHAVWTVMTAGLGLVGLLALGACSGEPAETPAKVPVVATPPAEEAPVVPEPAKEVVDTEALIRGSQVYGEHCAACHGSIGEGDGPLALDASPAPTDLTRAPPRGAEARREAVVSGPGEHAFGPKLGEDLDALLLYVGSLERSGPRASEDGPKLGGTTTAGGGMRLGPGMGNSSGGMGLH